MNKQLLDTIKRIVLDSTDKYVDKWAVYRDIEAYEIQQKEQEIIRSQMVCGSYGDKERYTDGEK